MADASDAIEKNETPDPMDPSNEIVIQSKNIQSRGDIVEDIGNIFQATGDAISAYVGEKGKNKEAQKVKDKVNETAQILQILKDKDDDKDDDKESKWETAKDASKKTFEAITGAIEKFDTGDTGEIISGVFDILGSLSQFAALAGPKGQIIAAIVGPFCSIISSLFGAKPEPEESQEALIHRVVTAALEIQTSDDLRSSAAGVQKDLIEKMKYVQEFFDRADEMGELDRYFITDDSYVSAGSDFIGKLKYYIEKDMKTTDDETAKRNSIFISTYCTLVYIRCQHLLILSALYASHKGSRLVSIATKKIAEDQRKLCKELFDNLCSLGNRNTLTWKKVGSLHASQLDIIRGFYGKPMPGIWYEASGRANRISASADGHHIWCTYIDKGVWYSTDNGKNWGQVEDVTMNYLSVSGDGGQIWGIKDPLDTNHDKAYYRQGRNGAWKKTINGGKAIHVSACGHYIVLIDAPSNIYYCHCPNGPDKGYQFHIMTTKYKKKRNISRVLVSEEPATPHSHQISLENDVEHQAVAKDLIKTDGVEEQAMQSKYFPIIYVPPPEYIIENVKGKFQSVSVSSGGSHIWATTTNGTIMYKSSFDNSEWQWKKGHYTQVCVSPNGRKIFGIGGDGTGNGELWCRNGPDAKDDFHFSNGDKLDGTINYVAVTNDKVWVVANDMKMYYQMY